MINHFVYKTTNIINGSYYIGVHSTENINDGYLGSGNKISNAIKKYGRNNFERAIISFHSSREEALIEEHKLVDLSDPLTYNIVPGGGNPPSKRGIVNPKVLLRGENRTKKQKEASIKKSLLSSGKPAHNRMKIEVFGEKYESKNEARQKLKLSFSQLKYYLQHAREINFVSVEDLKTHILKEKRNKLSKLAKTKSRINGRFSKS